MHRTLISALGAISLIAFPSIAHGQDIQWEELQDDETRADLGRYDIAMFAPAADKAPARAFVFPTHAGDAEYGIDVSHHNGAIDWTVVAAANVKLAYIKASQGRNFRDSRFAANWEGAGKANIRRGAYHFFSAGVPGKDQARAYLAMLQSVGGLQESDLTPVLDLEWDFATVDGNRVDRWNAIPAATIIKEVTDWLTAVEQATGRKPMIYTARSWWTPKLGSNLALQSYSHWVADYRQSSINAGAPARVPNHNTVAWQFSDAGRAPGMASRVDANKVLVANWDVLFGR